MNYIWLFMFVVGGTICAVVKGPNFLTQVTLDSAKDAITFAIGISGSIALWSGIMKIAESAGMLTRFAKFLRPILSKLFPSVPKDNPSLGYIASNIAANMLGLGSAATPFGLKAMSELQKINDKKDTASTPMITFLVLNTAGVTIIPTTIIAIRLAYNSLNPTEIIAPALISTSCSCLSAVLIDYFIRRKRR